MPLEETPSWWRPYSRASSMSPLFWTPSRAPCGVARSARLLVQVQDTPLSRSLFATMIMFGQEATTTQLRRIRRRHLDVSQKEPLRGIAGPRAGSVVDRLVAGIVMQTKVISVSSEDFADCDDEERAWSRRRMTSTSTRTKDDVWFRPGGAQCCGPAALPLMMRR